MNEREVKGWRAKNRWFWWNSYHYWGFDAWRSMSRWRKLKAWARFMWMSRRDDSDFTIQNGDRMREVRHGG